jgi:hypothetical protein
MPGALPVRTSAAGRSVAIMKQKSLFLLADASLRSVIDRIRPDQFDLPAPGGWLSTPDPTVRDVIAAHAKDEAWVPDVLAGRTMEEVGTRWDGDLLGDDPIASYDAFNDTATAAVTAFENPDAVAHLSYGDYPVTVYFEHTAFYRGFQAPTIAKFLGLDYSMPTELVDALYETVTPQLDSLRAIGVFPPEVPVPAGSDRETQLLGLVGFYSE